MMTSSSISSTVDAWSWMSGGGAAGAAAHSSEAVRHRIKQLVDGETADNVLSDDALVQKLRDEGVDIARRTVAKYRESLRIPSSIERRRERSAQGVRVLA